MVIYIRLQNSFKMKNCLLVILFMFLMVGEYIPQKDKHGQLLPKQCWGSTGTCWCAFTKNKIYFRSYEDFDCPKGPI